MHMWLSRLRQKTSGACGRPLGLGVRLLEAGELAVLPSWQALLQGGVAARVPSHLGHWLMPLLETMLCC